MWQEVASKDLQRTLAHPDSGRHGSHVSQSQVVLYKMKISDTNTTTFQCAHDVPCLPGQKVGNFVPPTSVWTPSALQGAHWISWFSKIVWILSERDIEDNLVHCCHYRNEKTCAKEVVWFIEYSQSVGLGDFKVDSVCGNKEIRMSMKF